MGLASLRWMVYLMRVNRQPPEREYIAGCGVAAKYTLRTFMVMVVAYHDSEHKTQATKEAGHRPFYVLTPPYGAE